MLKLARRFWKYMTAKLTGTFNERADPKVQLEQAIIEAQDQHRRLREQAANVIASQKQTEMRLDHALQELERVNANARQAVRMAEDASTTGDAAKATQYTTAAEAFANKMIALESEIDGLKALHLQATQAAVQAKAAVEQNSAMLQKKLSERHHLMGQLEQAKMQEQMNKAMASLSENVGQDVPTFNEVRDKIEYRYAKAKGMAELQGTSVEGHMMEIEAAARNTEARARLDQIRAELGMAPGGGAKQIDTPSPPA
jgi:phage shock protein A